MTKSADSYIAAEKHLPIFMRDFHDQKDLFKAISMTYPEHPVSWVDGHCYTIDRFLPFMAKHGYTLQRTRAKMRFADIRTTVANCSEELRNQSARLLNASKGGL